MSKSSPQFSSIYFQTYWDNKTCQKWLNLVKNENEYRELIDLLFGMPISWLNWVEKRIQLLINNGIIIQEPLNYRISVLWNGIILLQENKYLCDIMENTLKEYFFNHLKQNNISFSYLKKNIPKYSELKIEVEKERSTKYNSEILDQLSFHQLITVIKKCWSAIPNIDKPKTGFDRIFWSSVQCRDVNKFAYALTGIRNTRNDIAHSKKLFTIDDTEKLYRNVSFWLKPLNITVENRVIAYRKKRPNFLEDIHYIFGQDKNYLLLS